MRGVTLRGVELDACPACRSVWFDLGELEAYFERTLHIPRRGSETDDACPRCSNPMHGFEDRRSGARLSACPEHGVLAGEDAQKKIGETAFEGSAEGAPILAAAASPTASSGTPDSALGTVAEVGAEVGLEIGLYAALDALASILDPT